MSKFRIHNSFEEELAKKADEFTLQPRVATWKGVDRGIQKAQSIKQAIRLAIVSTCAIVAMGLVYFQSSEEEANQVQNTAPIAVVSPTQENPLKNIGRTEVPPTGINQETTKRKPNFSHLRSFPGFDREEPIGSFNEELRLGDELNNTTKNMALHAVMPQNIALSLSPKGAESESIKRRKRPVSIRHKDAWYINASVAPAVAFRSLSARTAYAAPYKSLKDGYDHSVKTYSAKIALRYFFTDRFSLGFGLRYTQLGEIVGMAPRKNNSLYTALADEYNYDVNAMNSIGNAQSHMNQYHYLELPVTIYAKRNIGKRYSLHTGIGMSLGYMAKESSRVYDFRVDHYVNNSKFLRRWAVGAHMQLNLAYDVNTRWSMYAGPELNYALLSTYQNYYTLSQHQYSLGLNLGVQWKLFDGTKSRAFGLN